MSSFVKLIFLLLVYFLLLPQGVVGEVGERGPPGPDGSQVRTLIFEVPVDWNLKMYILQISDEIKKIAVKVKCSFNTPFTLLVPCLSTQLLDWTLFLQLDSNFYWTGFRFVWESVSAFIILYCRTLFYFTKCGFKISNVKFKVYTLIFMFVNAQEGSIYSWMHRT